MEDGYDLDNLVNEAERLVVKELKNQLHDAEGICRCQECFLDMAAYALNNVRPYYHVSLMGNLYAQAAEDTGYAEEINKAVKKAIQKVQNNPAHD